MDPISSSSLLAPTSLRERKRAAKACEGCRIRKTRCHVLSQPPCVRCMLENVECVMNSHSRPQIASCTAREAGISAEPTAACQVPVFEFGSGDACFDFTYDIALPEDFQFQFPSPHSTLEGGLQKQPAHIDQCHNLPAVSSPNSCWAQRSSATQLAPIGICNVAHLSAKDLDYLTSRGVFNLPPKQLQDELVKKYFLHVHPFLPLLNEYDFWSEYDHGLQSTSFLVYRAILFAACPFVPLHDLRDLDQCSSLREVQQLFFDRARLLLDFETETDELTIVQAALLFSYRSARLSSRPSRRDSYWLNVAFATAKGLSSRHKVLPMTADNRNLVKRVLWCCLIRDTILTLGYRSINTTEPNWFDVSLLDVEDVDDSITYSKVYGKKAKHILAKMVVSLAELTSIANRYRSIRFSRCSCSKSNSLVLESLIETEKASTELSVWHRAFLGDFSDVGASSITSETKMLMLHRNMALMVYHCLLITINLPRESYFSIDQLQWSKSMTVILKSSWERTQTAAKDLNVLVAEVVDLGLGHRLPVTVTTTIVNCNIIHALQRNLGHTATHLEDVEVHADVLESLQERYPAVGDVAAILRAGIRFAEHEIAACTIKRPFQTNLGGNKWLPDDDRTEVVVHKAILVLRAISFLDQSFHIGQPIAENGGDTGLVEKC
ncbi:fungal-specific transcription factor domain-containing protein [Fusarium oxysporum f. sp. albedinis]|nr:fungal-specific transcription factor domain-containing protein [Fusarium oxysporum f. sp. albedinis]